VRPEYPDDAVDWLVERLDLREGRVVVDLAAGTGKLTRRLVPTRATVVAVEPLAEMREQLEHAVPGVDVLDGTAEAIPLDAASADAVTVGQAFHWFDAEAAATEIARVVRPGGALAPLWNIRDLSDPLQAQIDGILRPYRRETPSEYVQPWVAVLERAPSFGPPEQRSFPWVQPHTTAELVDRISSVSYVARLDAADRKRLLDHVRATVADLPEPFGFTYRTDVFVYPRV